MDKHLNGSATPEEEKILFDWYDSFQKSTLHDESIDFEEQSLLFEEIESRISRTGAGKSRKIFWLKIAASLIFLLFSALVGWSVFSHQPTANAIVSITTKKLQKQHLLLPDGTVVWLNEGSSLNYPSTFVGSQREVWLKGEAYFEVKHDRTRPFLVQTADLRVRVLGTVFNVKAYPHKKAETSLLKGSVEVTLNHTPERKIMLKPYQKLIVENQPADQQIKSFNHYHLDSIKHESLGETIAEIAWTKPAFTFSNERFEDIAGKLEKGFDLHIIIQNPAIKDYRFTGTFTNASIHTVLNALQFSNEFKYRKEGEKTIIIY